MSNTTPKKKLTAADIMQRDVVAAHRRDSLSDAMALITENHVTGLPVVDAAGHCVGVISATDILGYEQDHSDFTAEANTDLARYFNPDRQRWESVRVSSFALEEFADIPVEEVMSVDPVTVNMTMSIEDVAQTMVDHRIHRVVVVDEKQKLCGIISAFDFVRLAAIG